MVSGQFFNFSYWELKQYFKTFDLIVVGGGIVGLSTAISFREKNKKATVLILERGLLPDGASTKNAGFACFGSPGELLDDLKKIPEDLVWETVRMRWDGLQLLRKRIGDKNMAYEAFGGYELFMKKKLYDACLEKLDDLNYKISKTLGLKKCYASSSVHVNKFQGVKGSVVNQYEGQLDTSLMMSSLLKIAYSKGIAILNNIAVSAVTDTGRGVEIQSNAGVFKARQGVVATNGFATQLLDLDDVKPARAQVLVTSPIKRLKIKGAFHFNEGYYYFRNIDQRVLFGGGRNLDFKGETTVKPGLSSRIHDQLDDYLQKFILRGEPYQIEQRWSGIMGVGREKKPIIKHVSPNVLAAVRMGGMGIAIGSLVGRQAAGLL